MPGEEATGVSKVQDPSGVGEEAPCAPPREPAEGRGKDMGQTIARAPSRAAQPLPEMLLMLFLLCPGASGLGCS